MNSEASPATGQSGKLVNLSVLEFALPVPRRGSIETLSGYGRASSTLGQELHSRVQTQLKREVPSYHPEKEITQEFQTEEFKFRISGRMDGYFEGDELGIAPKIEEIKTAFAIDDLKARLKSAGDEHPYVLQLKTYGYFFWLEHKVLPRLFFRLISTRTFKTHELEIKLDIDEYESWLKLRLDELVYEARWAQARAARRKKLSRELQFPFDQPREGQLELIAKVEEGFQDKKRLLIQAPTGLGKTVGVLYPSAKEALARGQRVIYITPKNSQHLVAENAVDQFKDRGSKIKSLTITAKSKICFKGEPLCNPDFCEYAKDHYTKVAANGVQEILAKKRKLTAKTFEKVAQEFEVCPFEIQLDAAQDADVVICDYNYAFAPNSAFGRLAVSAIDQDGKPNLVIDEAHNLPSRAMDYYSPSLSTQAFERMAEEMSEVPLAFRGKGVALLGECVAIVRSCQPKSGAPAAKILPPTELFLAHDTELREFLSRYLDSDVEIKPRDVVLRLCYYWSQFTAALEFVEGNSREEFFMSFHSNSFGSTVKITCCDASKMLEGTYGEYQNVVGFSATLKPFDYYSQLSGLKDPRLKTAEFASPFPKSNRKLIVIPQVSSKYSEREKNYPRIAEAIAKMVELKKGNYFAFFPSFDFLERVRSHFRAPPGFKLFRQERGLTTAEVSAAIESLKEKDSAKIIFAVQGGVFAEGVDYPGDMVIGAFVVGAPLPNFDLEREQMREYYQKNYESGFDYAYTFPAMAKAVQAAGRVIRSETDRGLIVMMDHRFIEGNFCKSMPQDWFDESPRELVSQRILQEVAEFWQAGEL